jgi:hypothetical protein
VGIEKFERVVAAGCRRRGARPPDYYNPRRMDRRLALKNVRTGLIAGTISVLVLAASFVAAFLY